MKSYKSLILIFIGVTSLLSLVLNGCTKQETTPTLPAPSPTTVQPLTPTQGPAPSEIHPNVTQIDVFRGLNFVYLIRGEKTPLSIRGQG